MQVLTIVSNIDWTAAITCVIPIYYGIALNHCIVAASKLKAHRNCVAGSILSTSTSAPSATKRKVLS